LKYALSDILPREGGGMVGEYNYYSQGVYTADNSMYNPREGGRMKLLSGIIGTSLTVTSLVVVLVMLCVLSCKEAGWRKGRYWYFLDNIQIADTNSAEFLLWVALPMNRDGQEVRIEKIYPDPAEIISDTVNDNEIVFWRVTDFGDATNMYFYYDFQVLPARIEHNIDPQKVLSVPENDDEFIRYTISEPWIELVPEIREKAREIIGDETNPYFQARKIFHWVVDNMSYEYPAMEDRGAVKSYAKLKGDCGEYSFVFEALCRSVGVPARTVTCVWFQGGGHAWSEIYIRPYGWIPVDASVADLLVPGSDVLDSEEAVLRFMETRGIPERNPDYLFGNLYPNRMIVFVGNNAIIRSSKTGIERTFQFMQPGGSVSYPPAVELYGLSKQTVHTGFYLFGDGCDDIEQAHGVLEKELAAEYFSAEMFDMAEKGFLKKVEERPDDAISWFYLGQIYMDRHDLGRAIEAFEKSIAGKAGSVKPVIEVWARNMAGQCYDLQGNREKAIEQYTLVIESGVNMQGAVDTAKKYLEIPYTESE
jgi:hypothetical protein